MCASVLSGRQTGGAKRSLSGGGTRRSGLHFSRYHTRRRILNASSHAVGALPREEPANSFCEIADLRNTPVTTQHLRGNRWSIVTLGHQGSTFLYTKTCCFLLTQGNPPRCFQPFLPRPRADRGFTPNNCS